MTGLSDDVLELGYQNRNWNTDSVAPENIESWLWHYAEDEADHRRKFGEDMIAICYKRDENKGAEEAREREGHNLRRLVEMLFT